MSDQQTQIIEQSGTADPPGVNGEAVDRNEVMSVLGMDKVTNPAPQSPPADATVQPVQGTQDPPPQAAPIPAKTAEPAKPDPLVSVLGQLADRIQQMPQAAPAPTAQPAQPPSWEQPPAYQYTIPADVMAAIGSEDAQQQHAGLAAVAQGVSRNVHQTVMKSVNEMIKQSVVPFFQQQLQQAIAQNEIYRDFYSEYKAYNTDELRPVVVATAERVFKANPNLSWPAMKVKIGEELNRLLPGAAAPPPAQSQAQRPPAMVPQGSRGGPVRTGWNEQDDIRDTLGLPKLNS